MVAEDLEIIWYVILYAMQTILALMVVLRNKCILYEDISKCDIDLNWLGPQRLFILNHAMDRYSHSIVFVM